MRCINQNNELFEIVNNPCIDIDLSQNIKNYEYLDNFSNASTYNKNNRNLRNKQVEQYSKSEIIEKSSEICKKQEETSSKISDEWMNAYRNVYYADRPKCINSIQNWSNMRSTLKSLYRDQKI